MRYEFHRPPARDWGRLWLTHWLAMADWMFGRAWREINNLKHLAFEETQT